jgi:hypothetical protein
VIKEDTVTIEAHRSIGAAEASIRISECKVPSEQESSETLEGVDHPQ